MIKFTKKDIIEMVEKTLEEVNNPVNPMMVNPGQQGNLSEMIKQRLGKNLGAKPQVAPNAPQSTPVASKPQVGKMPQPLPKPSK
jgi:hypothetical protein